MTRRFIFWLNQIGLLEDETLNVLAFGGQANQTVSVDAAVSDLKLHQKWAVWVCAALSVLVQKGHCPKQIAGVPMSACNYVRAVICITVLFVGAAFAVEGIDLLTMWVARMCLRLI